MAYYEGQDDAPGGINETKAAVAAGLAQAMTAVTVSQGEARQFLVANGAQVLGGHSPVNAPGRQGDPDPAADAADG